MVEKLREGISLFEIDVTPDMVRNFVREFSEASDAVKEARASLKEAESENDDIERIDDEIKALKEERKSLLETNPVLAAYATKLKEATEDRKQLVADAKTDGIPKKEIDTAIKMLKGDIDPDITTEVFTNIADLVE